MAKIPSNYLAEEIITDWTMRGYVRIESLDSWLVPSSVRGVHDTITQEEALRHVSKFMRGKAGITYEAGQIRSVLELVTLEFPTRLPSLRPTHIAFSDGMLDMLTFKFSPFSADWCEGTEYGKGDKVTQTYHVGGIERQSEFVSVKKTNPKLPPSSDVFTPNEYKGVTVVRGNSNGSWVPYFRHDQLAVMSAPFPYSDLDDKSRQCPNWERFITEIMLDEDGNTSQDLCRRFSLMCGCLILPHKRPNRIFFLAGPTANNGKSTALQAIESIFPRRFVSHKSFGQIAGKDGANYEKAELCDKLINIVPEESSDDVDANILKQVSDGKTAINARRIYGSPMEFVPNVWLVVAFNLAAVFRKVDAGVARRFCYLPCRADFSGAKRKTEDEVLNPIFAEKEAMLAWFIVKAREMFDLKWEFPEDSEDTAEAKKHYLLDQNSALRFAQERIIPLKEGDFFISSNDMYDKYLEWCHAENEKGVYSKKRFSEQAGGDKTLGKPVNRGIRGRIAKWKPKETLELI